MVDLIRKAIDKSKQSVTNRVNIPSTDIEGIARQQANARLSDLEYDVSGISDRIEKLPNVKTPELLKREIEARVQLELSSVSVKRQEIEEEVADKLKRALELYVAFQMRRIPYPKLPVFDPKTVAWNAYLKIRNEISELKQKISKENLKKSREKFTYPITNVNKPTTPPVIKSLPLKF